MTVHDGTRATIGCLEMLESARRSEPRPMNLERSLSKRVMTVLQLDRIRRRMAACRPTSSRSASTCAGVASARR